MLKEAVIQSIDASTIYEVPNLMLEEGLDVVAEKIRFTKSSS
jgi:CTP synthase